MPLDLPNYSDEVLLDARAGFWIIICDADGEVLLAAEIAMHLRIIRVSAFYSRWD